MVADRVRVLIVIDSLKVGGAEALLPTLIQHIDRDRFDVRVLALNTVDPNHIQDEVGRIAESLTQWPARPLRDPRRVLDIARLIRDQDIDIVHSHLLHSNVQAALAARITRRPIVATLHNLHQHGRLSKRKVEVMVLRLTGAHALAVSDGVRRSYSGRYRLSGRQLTVVPNAIDLSRFERLDRDAIARVRSEVLGDSNGPLIVGVGRVVPQKGFGILARAAAEIHQRCPGARIVIAGREADGAAEVRAVTAENGLDSVVNLIGQRGDIPYLLAASDVFVSPSLSEGAPVTHLEAMATGTPVVATAVGGVPELIQHGVNGLLVPAGDVDQLASALIRVIENPDLAQSLADRGRETVRNYGADAWARRIEREYLRLLDGRSLRVATEAVQ